MRRPTIHQIAAAGALALITVVPLAACGSTDSLKPLPAEAAEANSAPASPSATAPPRTSLAPTTRLPQTAQPPPAVSRPKPPKTTRPTTTKPTGTCLGAVRYDLDLQNTVLDLVRSMCFHTGGVLRLQGIGPGLVTATPTRLVSQNYEGGVVDLRFVRSGTVTVTIPQDEQTYTITVVVR
jgi:hypothetical protein